MANGPQYETLWKGSLGDFNNSRSKNNIIGQWLNSINVPTASMEDWDESSYVCLSLLNICFVFAHGSLQLYVNWVVLEPQLACNTKMDESKTSSNNLTVSMSVCPQTFSNSSLLNGPKHPCLYYYRFPPWSSSITTSSFLLPLCTFCILKLSKRCKICRRYAGMQNGHSFKEV